MIHKELIPFEEYEDQFHIPYIAQLAETLREKIRVTGVKNCFVLEAPIFIPDELKPVQLVFQRKGDEEFECSDNGTIAKPLREKLTGLQDFLTALGIEHKNGKLFYTLYADNNLRDQFLKFFQIFRIWDGESGDEYFGIQFPFHLSSGEELSLYVSQNVTGNYFVEQEFNFQNVDELCKRYDITANGKLFYMTIPNVHTQFSARRILDFLQFIFLADHM